MTVKPLSRKFPLLLSLVASAIAFAIGHTLSRPSAESDKTINVAAAKLSSSIGENVDAIGRARLPAVQYMPQETKTDVVIKKVTAAPAESYFQRNDGDNTYQPYEAQVQQNIPPPGWFYIDRNVYAEVAAIDPSAAVTGVKCGDTACRVEVRHESDEARGRFMKSISGSIGLTRRMIEPDAPDLGVNSASLDERVNARPVMDSSAATSMATAYHFPDNDPTVTIMYVLKVESPEEMLQKLQARLSEQRHE